MRLYIFGRRDRNLLGRSGKVFCGSASWSRWGLRGRNPSHSVDIEVGAIQGLDGCIDTHLDFVSRRERGRGL